MAFWTLEQLLAEGGLIPERLALRFCKGQIFGIGKSVREFVANVKDRGLPWVDAGAHSAGNGAVMRIAPVLIPHLLESSPALWADAAIAGMVTHNDRTSNACCVAMVALLWAALDSNERPAAGWWLDRFVEVAGPLEGETELVPRCDRYRTSYRGPLARFVSTHVREAIDAGKSVREISDEFWSAAFLLETIPAVLAILERHSASPRDAIVRAVNDTWDNDTVAAIVGAVVGALHGRKALPQEWVDGLLGRTGERDDGRVFELIRDAKRWVTEGDRGAAGKRPVTPLGRRRKCPRCGSRSVAQIQYGFPGWSWDLEEAMASGRVDLGGCDVTGNDPDRRCNDCGHGWRSGRRRPAASVSEGEGGAS
jgi:ADP-ribosylglycohydrolase